MNIFLRAKKQPNLLIALKNGVTSLARHAYLILFPFLFDIALLFSPRLTISQFTRKLFGQMVYPASISEEMKTTWEAIITGLTAFFKYFNLSSLARTYPFGIPSLFAVRAFTTTPNGDISATDIASFGQIFTIAVIFILLGLFIATLFFQLSGMAVSEHKASSFFMRLTRNYLSVLALSIASLFVAIFFLFPGLLIVSLLMTAIPFLGMIAYMILLVAAISLLLPLVFTPHVIALENQGFLKSALISIRTVRPTSVSASTFVLLIATISFLSNLLWQTPPDSSWMLIVGALGHAIISTILTLASFHFFLDAVRCVSESIEPTQQPA